MEGLGELAFPLPASQVKELIPLAEAAPYGLGEKTVLDESVRKCWQLDEAQLSFKSPEWQKFLDRTVACVRENLGVEGRVSAIPYKLLIYGKGGHFRAHRDTEKLDAMFGTLIIALPCAHEGGRLFVRHDGREMEVDFSREKHAFRHAAFFADCEHEVEPVRSGFRCCLVYNLRLDAGDPGKLNLSQTAQARTLLAPLKTLLRSRAEELTAVLLEHGYTEANLTIRNLKGHDQSRARALFAASEEAGAVAHLALVTFHQSGELQDGYGYGRRRYGYDDRSQLAPGDREETRILLAASHLLADEEDRKAAVTFLRGDSSLAYVRETLGPVLLEKSVQKILAIKNSLAPEILAFAKDLLAAEVARPLNPYPDWARPCPQPNVRTYGPIRELLAFMADPETETHRFTRIQGERESLEGFIRQHALDLDFVTITKGRPYTLACTKNDQSHRRALARRAKDEELLGRLVG